MMVRRGLVALTTVALALGAANTSEISRNPEGPMPSASVSAPAISASAIRVAPPASPKPRRTLQMPPAPLGERDIALGILLLLTQERGIRGR
jgi:hypothetical protein